MSTLSCDDSSDFMGLPPDSPGSSVSTTLQEEYDELLKYAVIVPSYSDQAPPRTLSDLPNNNMPLFQTLANMVAAQKPQEDLHQPNSSQNNGRFDGSGAASFHVNYESGNDEQSQENDDTVTDNGDEHTREDTDIESIHSISQQNLHQQSSTPLDHTPTQQLKVQSRIYTKTISNVASRQGLGGYERPASPVDSIASSHLTEEYSLAYTGGVDPDIARMENMMDQWTLDLKRNVLAEFGQSKIRLLEHHKQIMLRERERHATEKSQLQNELEAMKELLHRYENSVERKDQVISNLTRGLQKHKEKNELMRVFCEWKISHNNSKKESFASKLAEKHYHHVLQKRCWYSWHSLIENKWKNRVEKACQSKAQEICMGLTNEYESQISALNSALDTTKQEVEHLRHERERYEETMKKAFMRGVCALNMEAMSMFHEGDGSETSGPHPRYASSGSGAPQAATGRSYSDIDHLSSHSHTVPQEPVFNSEPPGAPLPRVVNAQQSTVRSSGSMGVGFVTQGKSFTSGTTKRGKTISAKVTAKVDTGRSRGGVTVLAPPMSSVIVERHQPVVKQTIGHATASQYPVSNSKPVVIQKKVSGGLSDKPLPPPNIHKVKVVE